MLCMAGHPLHSTARAPYRRTPQISSKTICKAVDLNSAYSSNARTQLHNNALVGPGAIEKVHPKDRQYPKVITSQYPTLKSGPKLTIM